MNNASPAAAARGWSGLRRLGWVGALALAATLALAHGLDTGAVQRWGDESGQATFEEARAAFQRGEGRPADEREVLPLGGGRSVWYRLDLPRVSAPAQMVLALPIASLDLVELYRPDGRGGWTLLRAGDSMPVADWPIRYLHPAFPMLLLPADANPVAYVHVRHSHPVSLQLLLRDAGEFNEANKLWHVLLGGYVGFLLLVMVLAAAHAVLWRDAIHLFYGAHVLLIGLVVLSLTGLAGEYLWPRSPWWNDIAPAVLSAAALGGIGLFLRELVAERGNRALPTLLLALSLISFVIALGYLQLGRASVFLAHNVNAAVSLAVFLWVSGRHAMRQPKVGGWVFAGLAALALGASFPVMRNLGLEPPAALVHYGLQFGAALEIPLVLIGLYFRSRERRDNHLRVHALARTDPLTGVASHRVLVERLEQLVERHRRDALAGAVLRVRVANLPNLANDYGREAAEAGMVRAAECVAQQAKEGDTVAREQGGDLVLVLEGRLSREQVMATGRDIIAAGLKFSGRLPPGVTLSLQVAGACAPLPRANALLLLSLLGDMLQDIGASPGGRPMRIVQGSAGTPGEAPVPAAPA